MSSNNLKTLVSKNYDYTQKLLSHLKNPMNSHQKQKFYSYYSLAKFRRAKPTLNRLQNVILHQKQLMKINQPPVRIPQFKSNHQKIGYLVKQNLIRKYNYAKKEVSVLLNSRIIQMMMLIPAMYLSYNIGRQAYISYLAYQYPQHFTKPATPIKDKFKRYIASVVGDILTDKEVEQQGLDFLSKLFRDPETHEAGVFLLKNVLNDPRFVDESKLFGVQLISSILRTEQSQDDFKQLVMNTLREEEVKNETVNLLRYIVGRTESEDILALYFKTIFLRDDMGRGVTNLLTKAAIDALDQPVIKDKFGKFVLQVANNQDVKTNIYQNYLVKPAKRFFSFGILSGENGDEAGQINNNKNNNDNSKEEAKEESKQQMEG